MREYVAIFEVTDPNDASNVETARRKCLTRLQHKVPDLAASDVTFTGPDYDEEHKFWFVSGKCSA